MAASGLPYHVLLVLGEVKGPHVLRCDPAHLNQHGPVAQNFYMRADAGEFVPQIRVGLCVGERKSVLAHPRPRGNVGIRGPLANCEVFGEGSDGLVKGFLSEVFAPVAKACISGPYLRTV